METTISTLPSLDNLLYLPRFAAYLLAEKSSDFTKKQFEYCLELEIPLMKFFLNIPEEQRQIIARESNAELLGLLAANKASQQIERSLKKWEANLLPVINRDTIVAEDITLINYVRKKTMMHFMVGYTNDPSELIELVKEIDFYYSIHYCGH